MLNKVSLNRQDAPTSDLFESVEEVRKTGALSVKLRKKIRFIKDLSSSEVLLLRTFLDYADEEWKCYPGLVLLANETRLKKQTVLALIKKLEFKGVVKVEHRTLAHKKAAIANLYWIQQSAFVSVPAPSPVSVLPGPVSVPAPSPVSVLPGPVSVPAPSPVSVLPGPVSVPAPSPVSVPEVTKGNIQEEDSMREVSELEDSNSRRHAGRDSNTTIIPKDNMTLKSSLVRSASVSEPEVGELGESLAPAADLTTLAVPTPPIRKAEAEPSSPFAFRAPCASDLCRGEAEYRYDYCGPCLKEHPEAKRREEISVACQETSCVNTWEVHPQNRTLSKYCPQLHRLTKRREARELESKIFRAKQLR